MRTSRLSTPSPQLLFASPVGPLLIAYDAGGVRTVRFWRQGDHPPAGTRDEPARDDALGRQIVRELREYFEGQRRDFSVPLNPRGTEFQRQVWAALRRIPWGVTLTYAGVAESIGNPRAVRAVGQANRANPIPILIPCHRVVGAGGRLGGYMGAWEAGQGVEIKRWLLALEARGTRNAERDQ